MIPVLPASRNPARFHSSRGASLLEVAIGAVILVFLLAAATMISRTQIKSNTLSQDLGDESNVLRAFVDVLRTMEASSGFFAPNAERKMDFQGYRITMIFYGESSPAAYKQFPGLVLACIKAEYDKKGVHHTLETSTLLRPR